MFSSARRLPPGVSIPASSLLSLLYGTHVQGPDTEVARTRARARARRTIPCNGHQIKCARLPPLCLTKCPGFDPLALEFWVDFKKIASLWVLGTDSAMGRRPILDSVPRYYNEYLSEVPKTLALQKEYKRPFVFFLVWVSSARSLVPWGLQWA